MRRIGFLPFLLLTPLCHADKVDDYIRAHMTAQHIPGCSLAVLKAGRVVKMRSYGLADVELHVAATNDSVYKIGSMSKQFEAAALLELQREGKFDWDAPISTYLPNVPSSWAKVTGRQLMSHTSGLPDYTDSKEHDLHHSDHVSHEDVIRAIEDSPFAFPSGTQWTYCNTGSFLCGMAIEKVSGVSYNDFVQGAFFKRLGMTSTLLNDDSIVVPNRVSGYVWGDGKWMRPDFEDASWPFAGGGVLSSIKDMARWEQELHRREAASDASVQQMWTPVKLDGSGSYPYGLGWQLTDDRAVPNIWHTGHIPGFSSVISRFPSDGYTVILLTNADSLDMLGLAREIGALYDNTLTPAKDIQPTSDPDPAFTTRLTAALDALANRVDSPDLTPGIQKATTDGWREQVKESKQAGLHFDYLGADDVRARNLELLGSKVATLRHYRLSFAGMSLTEGFYFTVDGKLAFVMDE